MPNKEKVEGKGLNKRIIAIQVSPKAYDELQVIRGDETWTHFTLRAVQRLLPIGGSAVIDEELAALDARKEKAEPAPAEKPKGKKAAKPEPTPAKEGVKENPPVVHSKDKKSK